MKFFCCIILVLFFSNVSFAQDWDITSLADMPEAVSNNAVVAAEVDGKKYVYSFAGIDSSKTHSGIHNKCWRYDVSENHWKSLPDLPDPMGKIAAGASVVNGIAYIIGGYHVFSNGSELTSEKVHRFDLSTDTFLTDGSPIPKPVDDHVQVVYKDSLIYLVTGWSGDQNGGTNVANVQIYDPQSDSWQVGTSVPNSSSYKVFGSSGKIINDKIYYLGGAKTTGSFNPSTDLRIGSIDPGDPTIIQWEVMNTPFKAYRPAATRVDDNVYFVGGSDVTYNFNGIAYNGSGGVSPNHSSTAYDTSLDTIFRRENFPEIPMDLRSLGEISNTEKIIAGGMENGQVVSKKTWLLEFKPVDYVTTEEKSYSGGFAIFPNPSFEYIRLENSDKTNSQFEIMDATGQLVGSGTLHENQIISIERLSPGIYRLILMSENKVTGIESFIKL